MTRPQGRPLLPEPVSKILVDRAAWEDSAACLGVDPQSFTSGRRNDNTRAAQRICDSACPVRTECLDLALALSRPVGVWGGLFFADSHHGQRLFDELAARRRPARRGTSTAATDSGAA